ncbi:YrzI family small protein [Mesobacillus maritimus]|nr:YrzI family small protein [Mesobacillus maritimus]MCM3588846.1 YrzI family small protein [Mesobacillus maritimus]
MTLNLLFFTITLKRREATLEQELHNVEVAKRYEETSRKVNSYLHY